MVQKSPGSEHVWSFPTPLREHFIGRKEKGEVRSGLVSDHMLGVSSQKCLGSLPGRALHIRFREADALASGSDTEIQDLKGAISNPKHKHRNASPGPNGGLNETWHCALAGVWVHSEGLVFFFIYRLAHTWEALEGNE